jgi:hypothetical protein
MTTPSVFEAEFTKFVEAALADLVRAAVRAEVERLREPWVSVERAAEILSCSTASVRRAVARGQLVTSKPFSATKAGRVLVERASIDKLIEAARLPAWEWRHPWLAQPRIGKHAGTGADPEQTRRGKLGYERRRLRQQGLDEAAVTQQLRERGLLR